MHVIVGEYLKFGFDKLRSSIVAFNFMVHDPNGIIEFAKDKSFCSNDLMYRRHFVSE